MYSFLIKEVFGKKWNFLMAFAVKSRKKINGTRDPLRPFMANAMKKIPYLFLILPLHPLIDMSIQQHDAFTLRFNHSFAQQGLPM